MKYGRYGWSYKMMSWGLGAVFLWIGLDIFRHPEVWMGFVPTAQLPLGLERGQALQINGLLDIAIGVSLIMNWWPKLMAYLAAFHLISILVTQGIDAVLIRDVGLLGAALALALWPVTYRKKRWWNIFSGRRRRSASVEE